MAKRILLVDDDTLTQQLYQDVFTEQGYVLDVAGDGESGLTRAREGGYNLILLDVMMPKLDGLGVLSGLKAIPAKEPNGPIIMLTNLAHDDVVEEALKNGAKAALVKTDYNPQELMTKIKDWL